jgi:hypothetical protein
MTRNSTLAARVLKLKGTLGTILMNRICQSGQAWDVIVIIGHQAGDRWPPRLGIRSSGTDNNQTNASLSNFSVMKDVSLTNGTVGIGRTDVRGFVDNAVGNFQISDTDRFK